MEEIRQGQKIYKAVEAHHLGFSLSGYFMDSYIDFAAGKTLPVMLTLLGADTPFTFVVEGYFPVKDIFEFGEKRKMDLLQELRQLYNAEIAFDNFTITLTTRKGGNHGARIRYRHHMVGIKRRSHDMERINLALWLWQKWPDHRRAARASGQVHRFPPILTRPTRLWSRSNSRRSRTSRSIWPSMSSAVTYEAYFIQLEKADREYLDDRLREAGDRVTCYDEELYALLEGSLHIGKAPANALWAAQGSPRLLQGGNSVLMPALPGTSSADIWQRAALRTAGGLTAAGEWVIVRTYDAINLTPLAEIMRALGYVDAFNGDGGGSSYCTRRTPARAVNLVALW